MFWHVRLMVILVNLFILILLITSHVGSGQGVLGAILEGAKEGLSQSMQEQEEEPGTTRLSDIKYDEKYLRSKLPPGWPPGKIRHDGEFYFYVVEGRPELTLRFDPRFERWSKQF